MIMKRNKFTNNGGKYGGDKSTIKIIKISGLQQDYEKNELTQMEGNMEVIKVQPR